MRKALLAVSMLVSVNVFAQGVRAPTANESRLYSRLLAMTDTRSFDVALIDTVLASRWSPLRAAGALAIGQVGPAHGKPGIKKLIPLLSDGDLTVAANAAYAFGLLHDSTTVPALATALNAKAPVAREAAWALGEIGAPARASILKGLTFSSDDALTIQLLLAAAKLRPIPVAELRPFLSQNGKPSVQWAAAYAIARFRAPAGIHDLINLANHPAFISASAADAKQATDAFNAVPTNVVAGDSYLLPLLGRQRTRAEIARALTKGAAGDSLGDLAIPVLVKLASDAHPHVRINALRSLGSYGERGRDALVAGTKDSDANVRIAAAQSIGTALDSSVASWTALWSNDTTLMYRSSLLASASHAGVALPALAEWTRSSDWHYRAAALGAAAASTDTGKVTRAAFAMLRDPDGRVRANAYGLIGGNDTTALPPDKHNALIAGLSDADFYARATAIGNLSQHATAADAEKVLAGYTLALRDSGNDARIAAIQYLAQAWDRDSAAFSPELRQQIASLQPSDDPLVRAGGDSVSIFKSWQGIKGNPRPASWYDNIVRTYVIPSLRGQSPRATIRTAKGEIVLELFGADAPITVSNFATLAKSGYYRGTGFHRVVPNFVAQDGDPRDDGNGGPGYAIRDEFNPRRYERGALGMALSGPDTGGSQYFITHSPQPHLDGHYTVFGRVVRGLPALDAIVQGDRILSIEVR